MEELISHIVEEWFLTEPMLFAAFCTHSLEENTRMTVPMRTGKMRIEYNPEILTGWSNAKIEERLKYEVVRILLGHPYQRQPYKAKKGTLGIASDVTLKSVYKGISSINLPADLHFDKGLCFEEYYALVQRWMDEKKCQSPPYEKEGQIDDGGGGVSDDADTRGKDDELSPGDNENDGKEGNSDSGSQSGSMSDEEGRGGVSDEDDEDGGGEPGEKAASVGDEEEKEPTGLLEQEAASAGDEEGKELTDLLEQEAESAKLWEEDQLAAEQVKDVVRRAQRSRQWGSIGGGLKEEIEATTIVRIDYRTVLSWFRASVLSSKRHLTRMLPSRRYGFEYMGSKRAFSTRLLVAIDVSGSVVDEQVAQALSIINRFFKYGVESIDVIQFDVGLKGDPLPMKKAQKSMAIEGRGGTDFQAPIDYFLEHKYDGLIMITDGAAPQPKLPEHFYGNLLWMIYDPVSFRTVDMVLNPEQTWIANLPKSKYLILPPV